MGLIFKGHLTRFFIGETFQIFLAKQDILLKDFGPYFYFFNPLAPDDARLFAAAMSGEHIINGFRNRDLWARLYDAAATSVAATRRRCARVSHLIAKLRGHGLPAKIKSSRLYRVTLRGYRLMSAALGFRLITFPQGLATP